MIQDYEIKQSKPLMQTILPYIEFILILIIIQSTILLFTQEEEQEAIRFRIIAHSNAVVDQQMKEEVQRAIEPIVNSVLNSSSTNEELVDNLFEVEEEVLRIAKTITKDKQVTFERLDALFPPKRAGLIITPQAHYDAFIMTIGSGRGDNWWCSLFPTICYPAQDEEVEEEVTFFVWEWIKSFF